MLSDDDLVSVTVEQELLGEDIINVFYFLYEVTVLGATLFDLIEDFRTNIWTYIRAGQTSELATVNLVGRNLTNGVDIEELPGIQVGLDVGAGPPMPTYVAAGYRLNVGSLETRPGGKRFAGVGETRVDDNEYIAGGTVATDIEEKLALISGVTGTVIGSGLIHPIVIGRDVLGALDLLRFQPVTTAAVATSIRSQVSRRS